MDVFVFAGGGAAGAYQLGCIKAIYERSSIRPVQIYANSAGSLNAAGLSFAGLKELEKLWRGITKRKDIFGNRFLGWVMPLFGADSLWTSKPLKEKLEKLLKDRKPEIPLAVNYVDLTTGELMRADVGDKDFKKYLLASASIPILTPPVDGKYCDGGIKENTPLRSAVYYAGAKRVFVFLNSPKDRKLPKISKFSNVKEYAMRALSIMSDEVYWEDVNYFNELSCQSNYPDIIYLAPKEGTIDTLDFDAKKIAGAIDQGFNETVETLFKLGLLTVINPAVNPPLVAPQVLNPLDPPT